MRLYANNNKKKPKLKARCNSLQQFHCTENKGRCHDKRSAHCTVTTPYNTYMLVCTLQVLFCKPVQCIGSTAKARLCYLCVNWSWFSFQ